MILILSKQVKLIFNKYERVSTPTFLFEWWQSVEWNATSFIIYLFMYPSIQCQAKSSTYPTNPCNRVTLYHLIFIISQINTCININTSHLHTYSYISLLFHLVFFNTQKKQMNHVHQIAKFEIAS